MFVDYSGASLITALQTALQTLPSLDIAQNIDIYNVPQTLMLSHDRFTLIVSLNARTLTTLDATETYYLIMQHDTKEFDTILGEDLNNPSVSPYLKGSGAYGSYFEVRIRTNIPSYMLTIT